MQYVHEANPLLQVCGPLWTDYRWWAYDRHFTIGRCQILSLSRPYTDGVLAYNNSDYYMASIEIDGFRENQMKFGMAEFGFSAAGDGVSSTCFHYHFEMFTAYCYV